MVNIILSYFHADNIESTVDGYLCDNEGEAIKELTSVMYEIKPDRILKTAESLVDSGKIDEALQHLDTWIDEYNTSGRMFKFSMKEVHL